MELSSKIWLDGKFLLNMVEFKFQKITCHVIFPIKYDSIAHYHNRWYIHISHMHIWYLCIQIYYKSNGMDKELQTFVPISTE